MNRIYKISLLAGISVLFASCFNEKKPNYQYMPNMYESVAYETYGESDAFKGGTVAQVPAVGSIKRGFIPYELPNTNEGYAASKSVTVSPLDSLAYDEPKAQQLYTIYCAICHGDKGDGKGKLVQKEKFLGVPSYADREMTIGSVYHVETYGLNAMGSYMNQLTQNERWLVAQYVMKLRSEL